MLDIKPTAFNLESIKLSKEYTMFNIELLKVSEDDKWRTVASYINFYLDNSVTDPCVTHTLMFTTAFLYENAAPTI